MIDYEVVDLSEEGVLEAIVPLAMGHYDEVERERTGTAPSFDLEAYRALPGHVCILAKDSGKLVGYVVFIVHKNPRSKESLCATEEIYYVHPDYRGMSIGSGLLDLAESVIKDEYPTVSHLIVGMPSTSEMMEYLGYSLGEYVYMKKVEK